MDIPATAIDPPADAARSNVVLIVLDGVRWQDFFDAPGAALLEEESTPRMPYIWRELARRGVAFGDRTRGNSARVTLRSALRPRLSLPSYQAMLAGFAQPCPDNDCGKIGTETLPEALRRRLSLRREEVAVFASWSGLELAVARDPTSLHIDAGSAVAVVKDGEELPRADSLTFDLAIEHLRSERPRFLFISLDLADQRGHR